uniref:Uncharacterized protein n=1 Tax=Denticeps clupeoides TaxID=299321 RepID=A0AAY4A8Y6_9TELE
TTTKKSNNVQGWCEGSEMIFPALFLDLERYRSWMEGRGAPVILSAVRTVRCSLILSLLVAAPYQAVMEEQRTELDQQLLWKTVLPQLPQEVHPLLGLFEDGGLPLQVLQNGGAQEVIGVQGEEPYML